MYDNSHFNLFRGETQILKNTSLKLEAGKKYFLIGKNASGKSSLLQYLNGSLDYSIKLDSFYLPAEFEIRSDLFVRDLMDIFLEVKDFKKNYFYECFDIQEINLDLRWYTLSSGQKKRLILYLSLSKNTSLLLLDEPLNHLDPLYQLRLVKALNHYESSYVCVTHNFQLILNSEHQHVLLLDKAKLYDLGPASKAFYTPEFEKSFQIKSQITDNPLDNSKVLVLKQHEV